MPGRGWELLFLVVLLDEFVLRGLLLRLVLAVLPEVLLRREVVPPRVVFLRVGLRLVLLFLRVVVFLRAIAQMFPL